MRMWRGGGPIRVMTLALVLGAAVVALATCLLLVQPWLGLTLVADPSGRVLVAAVDPAAGVVDVPVGAEVLALGPAGGALMPLTADDLTPEPDVFPTYTAMAAFFERQSALTAVLGAGPVDLSLRLEDGTERSVTVTPARTRPLSDLPAVYWFQVTVGVAGLLLGCWVWALRRGDWSTRLFALTGLAILVFTTPAAIYSSRELALDGALFRLLSDVNITGALMFGAAMIGVFLGYPRRLVPPGGQLLPMAVFGLWLGASLLRVPPGPGLGPHLATLIEMVCIVLAIAAQWWATRRDPAGRAALTWLGLSVILGAGAFVAMVSLPPLVGRVAPLEQGYAFGFFLLIHAGLALGLRRYRLFELGDWAFRVILATLGLAALLALDTALIVLLNLGHGAALGLSLVAVGFLYLPMRDVLWRRLVRRRTMSSHDLFEAVMNVAFVVSPGERAAAWRGLLRRLFDPLELAPATVVPSRVEVAAEGLEMRLPPVADAGPLVLRLPWGGRSLFSPAHRTMAAQLVDLMAQAEAGREAHAHGARTERLRIARDLHDDVGARLLAALHQPSLPATRATVRDAMGDIRAIVSGLAGERLPLDHVLGDLRHEMARRLEAAGIVLEWPPEVLDGPGDDAGPLVDYPIYRALTAVLREATSNTIRHSRASCVWLTVARAPEHLRVIFQDDGQGLPTGEGADAEPLGGHGLGNMRQRVAELGGLCEVLGGEGGLRLELTLPLAPRTVPLSKPSVQAVRA